MLKTASAQFFKITIRSTPSYIVNLFYLDGSFFNFKLFKTLELCFIFFIVMCLGHLEFVIESPLHLCLQTFNFLDISADLSSSSLIRKLQINIPYVTKNQTYI